MDVIAPVLLRGAWYSLEQCGRLLSDAILLYREKSYSSAVALAMIGREELGKHRMLRSEERRVGKGVDLGGRRIIKKKKKIYSVMADNLKKKKIGIVEAT